MKTKLVIGIMVLLSVLVLSAVEGFGYSGGNGTPDNPYQIANVNDLLQLSGEPNDYNKCFIMTADINLAGYDFNNALIAPYYAQPWIDFTGTFDGVGHKISNLKIIADSNDSSGLGLFGVIGVESTVNNLCLENVYVVGRYSIYGGLAATNNGKIINCYADVSIIREVNNSIVGGLVGVNGGSVINCHTEGLITADIHYQAITVPGAIYGVGGLAGIATGDIKNCSSTVNIFNSIATGALGGTGGLVGKGYISVILKCFSTGSVHGYYNVGGLVGEYGNIKKCFSTGDVNGLDGVGGLVGSSGNVENSYSTGNVRGNSYVGGLAGSASATNCYSTGIVTGTGNYVGGLIGNIYGSSAVNSYFLDTSGPNNGIGTPLDNNEMKQCVNFNNWDFVWSDCNNGPDYIWFILDGVTYPDLAWHAGICTVPNVVGTYMTDANDKIIERGFTVGTITYDHNDTVSYGYVISQSPEPNSQPECGSAVNYVVSLGDWPCEIPDIVGMTMSDANITIIYYYGQTVGTISYAYSDTVPAGRIISQNPGPGPSECNLAINYVASLGELPDNNKFPDYDANGIVNFNDFAIFANAWLTINSTIDLTGDNYVNIVDLKVFCNHWLKEEP